MSFTDSDLRELLEQDSDDGHYRGVTIADVYRRIDRLRRRRRRVAGAVAGTVLAVTAAIGWLPSALSPGTRADVLSVPSPHPLGFEPGLILAQETFRTAGVRERLVYSSTTGQPMGLTVHCERPGHVFLWLNGIPVGNGICGGPDGRGHHPAQWWDQHGLGRTGENTVEALVVPQEALARAGVLLGERQELTAEETQRVLSAAERAPLTWRLTIRGNTYPLPFTGDDEDES